MRRTLLLSAAVLLAGCPAPAPTDPDLAKPCASRRAATLAVGTGDTAFDTLGAQGVEVQTGPQGGNHIWIAVSARGLGPDLGLSYGIKSTKDGTDLSGPIDQVVTLAYDPASDTDQALGLRGFLDPSVVSQIVGQVVLVYADATDTCHATPLHAEAMTSVTGIAGF